ncbi:MAG: hypothetical protein QOH98_1646, partial [Methylobacteriaceae bacterium]|nr:hypothetical protein [Methylobacteriaceae bacterium]
MQGIEEITAVHMNCASQATNRVSNGMDHIGSKEHRIPLAEGVSAGSLNLS